MSIVTKKEEWVTKKGKFAGLPGMKLTLAALPANYPNLSEPNIYKGNCNWGCNVLCSPEVQAEIEAELKAFAEAHIAAQVAKGVAKGDPQDEIKFQWKAKKVKGQGNIPIEDEEGNKILKVESWKWKEGSKPRPAPKCFVKTPEGKYQRIPNKKAIWYTGSMVELLVFAAVTYDEDKENWVAKLTLKQVAAVSIVKPDANDECGFGEEAEGDCGFGTEEDDYDAEGSSEEDDTSDVYTPDDASEM